MQTIHMTMHTWSPVLAGLKLNYWKAARSRTPKIPRPKFSSLSKCITILKDCINLLVIYHPTHMKTRYSDMQIIQRRHLSQGNQSPLIVPLTHFYQRTSNAPIPEIFLTGCSSAEPASACFRQNKCMLIQCMRIENKNLYNVVWTSIWSKWLILFFKRKKEPKKEKEKVWASPMDYFIRFAEALDQSIYPDLIKWVLLLKHIY